MQCSRVKYKGNWLQFNRLQCSHAKYKGNYKTDVVPCVESAGSNTLSNNVSIRIQNAPIFHISTVLYIYIWYPRVRMPWSRAKYYKNSCTYVYIDKCNYNNTTQTLQAFSVNLTKLIWWIVHFQLERMMDIFGSDSQGKYEAQQFIRPYCLSGIVLLIFWVCLQSVINTI